MDTKTPYIKNSIIGVAVLLSLFLFVVSIKEIKEIGYVGKGIYSSNLITVTGSGEAFSIPDVATFNFSVIEEAKVVGDAQKKATDKMNKALSVLKDAGIDEKDIKTQGYNIYPKYEYPQSFCSPTYCPPAAKPVLVGYEVSQNIEVKVRDTSKAGDVLSGVGKVGVQNINGLSFTVDNDDLLKDQARKEAIDKAQSKAKILAEQLGVKLVKVISFSEEGDYGMFYKSASVMSEGMGGDRMSVPLPTGEQKVTSNVSITYEIK